MKSQTVAVLLAWFLGGFGVHKFYLGRTGWGIAYLLLFWTGIPALVAMVETFILAFSSPQSFAAKYNNGQLGERVHWIVKVLVLILPVLFVLGVVAAVVLPAYVDYQKRSKAAEIRSVPSTPRSAPVATPPATSPPSAKPSIAPPATAPAPAPAPAVPAPSAVPAPAALVPAAPSAAAPPPAPRARPAAPAPQPAAMPEPRKRACVYKPVMTDEEIAACR